MDWQQFWDSFESYCDEKGKKRSNGERFLSHTRRNPRCYTALARFGLNVVLGSKISMNGVVCSIHITNSGNINNALRVYNFFHTNKDDIQQRLKNYPLDWDSCKDNREKFILLRHDTFTFPLDPNEWSDVFEWIASAAYELEEAFDGYVKELSKNSLIYDSGNGVNSVKHNLNQILFGPPGTGKTYSTINESLKILDPALYELNADYEDEGSRFTLKSRFDELVKEERIRFVTFHQSFSYEDFVEGLRAEPNDDNQIRYRINPGVFKKICEDAITLSVQPELGIRSNSRTWKISIDGTGQNPTKSYCFENDQARIGWGETGDLTQIDNENDFYNNLTSGNKGTLRYFAEEIEKGDILVCIHSNDEIAGVGVVNGSYRYENNVPSGVNSDYKHVLPVKWIYKNIELKLHTLNDSKTFVQKTVYSLDRLRWNDLLQHIENSGIKSSIPVMVDSQKKPFVLIIDEINRGNISRIFGELITLIEPSKRAGAPESLEVTLPYSKDSFSVPENVYLLGTMNTADRSLATMDIALRRRFTFIEMPPKPEVLKGINVDGVDIEQMLRVMNDRIEVLLGRDYCLGHAYFIELKAYNSREQLEMIFRQKIMPLLQEYFFEDWERISWVLNDQRKKTSEYQFIRNKGLNNHINQLFGDITSNLQDRRWFINETAFENIKSYLYIIDAEDQQ